MFDHLSCIHFQLHDPNQPTAVLFRARDPDLEEDAQGISKAALCVFLYLPLHRSVWVPELPDGR